VLPPLLPPTDVTDILVLCTHSPLLLCQTWASVR
jgi:hypothetical protein